MAGPSGWLNPFTFGLYGGSQAPGILDSDALAGPFILKHGYTATAATGVWQRSLERFQPPGDPRFAALRHRYDILGGPWRKNGWWPNALSGRSRCRPIACRRRTAGATAARPDLGDGYL